MISAFLVLLAVALLPSGDLTTVSTFEPAPLTILSSTAAATDGRNVLALYPDVEYTYRGFSTATLYANVVRPDGTTISPTRTLLGSGLDPSAVWTGDGYFVVWGDHTQVWFRRLDADGRPLDAVPRPLATFPSMMFPFTPSASIVWLGNHALVAWNQPLPGGPNIATFPTKVATISRDGTFGATRDLPFESDFRLHDLIATGDGVLLTGSGSQGVTVRRLTDDGTPTGVAPTIAPERSQTSIGRNGNRLLLTWQTSSPAALRGRILDASGAPVGDSFTVLPNGDHGPAAIAASGSGFAVVSRHGVAALVTAGGQVTEQRQLLSTPSSFTSAVTTADGRLAVAAAARLPFVQFFDPTTLQPLGEPVIISKAAPEQTFPAAAGHPRGHLVTWQERGSVMTALVGFDGVRLSEPRPVLPAPTGFARAHHLYRPGARYLVTAGRSWILLDENGVPAGDGGTFPGDCASSGGVVPSGDELLFFFTPCGPTSIELLRLDASGQPLGEVQRLQETTNIPTTRAVRMGEQAYVAWMDGFSIYGMRVGLDGVPLEAPRELYRSTTINATLELASDGERVFIAWLSKSQTYIANDFVAGITVGPDGFVITGGTGQIEILTEGGDRKNLLGTWWNGTTYTFAWLNQGDQTIHQARVHRDGHLVDAPPHRPLYRLPAFAAFSQSGGRYLFLSQLRSAEEMHGNVNRVFTHVPQSRRRAVR